MTSAGIRSGVNWMRAEVPPKVLRERAHQQRLAEAGHALDQHVAAGEQRRAAPGRSPRPGRRAPCRSRRASPPRPWPPARIARRGILSRSSLFLPGIFRRSRGQPLCICCSDAHESMNSAPRRAAPARACAPPLPWTSGEAASALRRSAGGERGEVGLRARDAAQGGVARRHGRRRAQAFDPVVAPARAQVVEQPPPRRRRVGRRPGRSAARCSRARARAAARSSEHGAARSRQEAQSESRSGRWNTTARGVPGSERARAATATRQWSARPIGDSGEREAVTMVTWPRPRAKLQRGAAPGPSRRGRAGPRRRRRARPGRPGRRRSTARAAGGTAAARRPRFAGHPSPRLAALDAERVEHGIGSRRSRPPRSGARRARTQRSNRARCAGVSACGDRAGSAPPAAAARRARAARARRRLQSHALGEALRGEERIAQRFAGEARPAPAPPRGRCAWQNQASASTTQRLPAAPAGAMFHARARRDSSGRRREVRWRGGARDLARVRASGERGVGALLPRSDQHDRNRRIPPAAGRRAPGEAVALGIARVSAHASLVHQRRKRAAIEEASASRSLPSRASRAAAPATSGGRVSGARSMPKSTGGGAGRRLGLEEVRQPAREHSRAPRRAQRRPPPERHLTSLAAASAQNRIARRHPFEAQPVRPAQPVRARPTAASAAPAPSPPSRVRNSGVLQHLADFLLGRFSWRRRRPPLRAAAARSSDEQDGYGGGQRRRARPGVREPGGEAPQRDLDVPAFEQRAAVEVEREAGGDVERLDAEHRQRRRRRRVDSQSGVARRRVRTGARASHPARFHRRRELGDAEAAPQDHERLEDRARAP